MNDFNNQADLAFSESNVLVRNFKNKYDLRLSKKAHYFIKFPFKNRRKEKTKQKKKKKSTLLQESETEILVDA